MMMPDLFWHLDPLSPNQLKKNVKNVGPPLQKLSVSVHATKGYVQWTIPSLFIKPEGRINSSVYKGLKGSAMLK